MKLSIITINLNNAYGLRKTIESLVNQTFTDYEYIIIDGNSTDGSTELIKEYTDKITYWVSEPDKGIYNAMNKGIPLAKGEYLLFLNSGDWLIENNILYQVFSEKYNADIIYGEIQYWHYKGMYKASHSLSEEELTLANFKTNSHATIEHQAAFIKRSLFDKDLYDEDFQIMADIHFFIKKIIFQNCTVKYLPMVIARIEASGISSKVTTWPITIEEREQIFAQLLPPRILKDYELVFLIKDSPLLKYIPILNMSTKLNKISICIVGLLIKSYNLFKKAQSVI
jgi:glycosyltransferase involved in cell wall biosynthesis